MTCYTDAAGSYVCPSQDPISATWNDLTTWTGSSSLHLIVFFVACLTVGLYFQHRRRQPRQVVVVKPEPKIYVEATGAPSTNPFDEWLTRKAKTPVPAPSKSGVYR